MIEQMLGYKMHRGLVQRQDDTTGLQLCLTNCLYGAVTDVMASCNFDIQCMCKNANFRNTTLTCVSDSCVPSGDSASTYEAAMTTELDKCARGEYNLIPTSSSGDDDVPTSTRKPGQSYSPSSSAAAKDDGPSTGLIAGAAVGGVVVVALFGILIWWLVKRNKRRNSAALENPPAWKPTSGPITPGLDDGKIGTGHPATTPGVTPGGGFNAYNTYTPYNAPAAPPATTAYANQAATGPAAGPYGTPHAELGYIPPSQFDMYGPGAGAAFAATAGNQHQQRPTSLYPTTSSSGAGSSSGVQLLTSATPPSQSGSGSTGSRPGTSDAGVGGFNPYLVQQQQAPPLQLHDPYAGGAGAGPVGAHGFPADVKRPLNVMSADSPQPQPTQPPQHQLGHAPGPSQDGELPPPLYTSQ